MPTWPATLPQQPQRNGYSDSSGYPVIEADTSGPPKARRRFTAAIKPASVSFVMTTAQRDTFETFYDEDLAAGALPYDWREWGDPNRPTYSWRITSDPEWEPFGLDWRVSFSLIRLP